MFSKRGKCVIFSAPSGAGKTTIVHYLLDNNPTLEFSVSACSRDPRGNEVDGIDYYFLGVEGFKEQLEKDKFVEWQEVYPNTFYGTLKAEIERIWKENKVVIFDVDVVGGLNLKRIFGDDALAIFVQPPTLKELETRLRRRSTESEDKIRQRMSKAKKELEFSKDFDAILINDNLNRTCQQALILVNSFLEK